MHTMTHAGKPTSAVELKSTVRTAETPSQHPEPAKAATAIAAGDTALYAVVWPFPLFSSIVYSCTFCPADCSTRYNSERNDG